MIAGFIFLRLRGILGKRTGFEGKAPPQFEEILKNVQLDKNLKERQSFDEKAKKEFLSGAKIAYETIITDFSDNDNKITTSKPLLSNKIFDQFNDALKERSAKGHYAEITFIGVNSAIIKEHKKNNNILQVTVDFVGEVITCIRDKEKKIISCVKDKEAKIIAGDPSKVKKVHDTWKFSKNIMSNDPNWSLVETNI